MDSVLIISDTHHNFDLLGAILKQRADSQYLIHLGDEPDDLVFFPEYTQNMQVFSVYGIYHPKWTMANACLTFTIKDIQFHIAHIQDHLKKLPQKTIYCFGHTHHRYFQQTDDEVYINPGHLKRELDRNEKAGYAMLEIDKNIAVNYCDFHHNLIESQQINFN